MSLTEDIIKIIAAHFAIPAEKIKMTDRFNQDLGSDSLDDIEVIMAVEEHYNWTIQDEQAEKIKTVAQLIEYVENKQK